MSCAAQKPFERLMECVGHPEMNADPRFKINEEADQGPEPPGHQPGRLRVVGSRDLQEVIETCEQLGSPSDPSPA